MVSKLGYRKDSPYKNRKSLTIDSNHITMKDVEFPLLLVPNNDNPVIAKPGEEYMFNNSQYVKEYRLKNMKYGGQTEELLMAYMAKMSPEEQAEFMARFEELGSQEKKMLLNSLRSQMHEVRNKYEEEDYMEMEDQEMEEYMYGGKKMPKYQWAGGVEIVDGEVQPRKSGVVRHAITGEIIQQPMQGNPADPLNRRSQGTVIRRDDNRVFQKVQTGTRNVTKEVPGYRDESGRPMMNRKTVKEPVYEYREVAPEDTYVLPNPYSPSKAIQDPFTLGAPMAARAIASNLVIPAITLPKIPARVTTPKPTGTKPTGTKPTPTRPTVEPTRPTVEPTRPVGGGRQPSRNPFNPVPFPMVPGDQDRYVSPDYNFGGGGAGGSWDVDMPQQQPSQRTQMPVVDAPEPVQARTPAKKSQYRYEEGETPETSGSVYTIQAGDTLSALARRFGTTVQELARLNNIQNVNLIRRGAQLRLPEMQDGGIYIDPAKRGTFKAQATRMGMGVQEAASKILSNKEDYSPAMVKKANFARNAASWKKEDGGMIEYKMGGELPEYQSGGSPSLYDRLSDFSWSMIGPRAAKSQSVQPPPEPTPAGPPSFFDRLSDFSWSMIGPPSGKPQALPPEPTPEEYRQMHEAWRQEEMQKPRGWVYREEGQLAPINPYTKRPLGFEWSDEQKLETGYYDEVAPRYGYIPNKNSRGIPKVIGQIPPSDPRSSTSAQKTANLAARGRAGLKDYYSEKGEQVPQVDYGDFTDPLNPRKSQWAPPTPRYKKGGQLPEYQEGDQVRVFNPDGSAVYVTKEEAMRRLNEITAPARTVFPLIPGGSATSRAMSGVVAMGRTSGKAAGAGAAGKAARASKAKPAPASTPPPPPPAPSATSTGANQMADEIFDAYHAMRPGMNNARKVGIAKNLEVLGVGTALIGIPTAFEMGKEAARRQANVPRVAMSSSMTKFLTDQGVSSLRQQSTPSQQSTPFMLSRSSSPAPSPARSTASTPRTPAQPITGDTYTIKSGDTLSRIAQRTGMSVQELAQINNIADPNKIYAGRQLMLRQPTAPTVTPTPPSVSTTPAAIPTPTPTATQSAAPRVPTVQQTMADVRDELVKRGTPVAMDLLRRTPMGVMMPSSRTQTPQQVNPRPAPPVVGLTQSMPLTVNSVPPLARTTGPDADIQKYRMAPQLNSVVKEGFAELAGLVDSMTDTNFERIAPRVERLMEIVNKELSRTTNYQGFTNVDGEYYLVPKGAARDRSKWVPFDTMPETSRPRLSSLSTLEPQSIPTAPASIQGLAAPKRFTNTRKRSR